MRLKAFTLMAACAVMLAGCDQAPEYVPTASGLYITGEGQVTSATVETYEEDYYTAEELKAYVEEALVEFNSSYGTTSSADGKGSASAASIRECTMADGTAKLVLDFRDAGKYLDFMTQYPDEESSIQITNLDITTVADSVAKGYLVGTTYTKLGKEQTTASADEVMKQSRLNVAVVEGAAALQPDGIIQYISDGVTVIGDNQVQTPADQVSYIVFK